MIDMNAVTLIVSTIFCFLICMAGYALIDLIKLRRNPMPKLINTGTRFIKIENKYLHEMFSVKTR